MESLIRGLTRGAWGLIAASRVARCWWGTALATLLVALVSPATSSASTACYDGTYTVPANIYDVDIAAITTRFEGDVGDLSRIARQIPIAPGTNRPEPPATTTIHAATAPTNPSQPKGRSRRGGPHGSTT